jgi:regulator of protease activity HflC (stomatin/prohibitin superfamily)
MERNTQKNGLVNLVVALLVFIAALAATVYVKSLAAQVAVVFLGLSVLVALMGWFQMRLEENERLEKLELDELARSKGDSTLFAARESEVFPARRSREQFEKYFVPGFAVLLLLFEAAGAWILWRWSGQAVSGLIVEHSMQAASLFGIFALILFLIGRFSVTLVRLENSRLLRAGSSFLLASAYVCMFTALAIAGTAFKLDWTDLWGARILCVLLGLVAVEQLLTLLLEIYRPRVKGKIARPLYDGRLVGLLAQPESLFTTAAQALDYQFGFKVSETWFYQLLQKNLLLLVLVQLAVLALSTCFVFVSPGEEVVLEHFGQKITPPLMPGCHLKLPWPWDIAYRYQTDRIQSLYVGFTPTEGKESRVILWSVPHDQEENYLVGGSQQSGVEKQEGDTNNIVKTPAVGLISVSIPVQYQITNVIDWAYVNSDPTNLLSELASEEVVRFLAGADLNQIMSAGRFEGGNYLRERIQATADEHHLGAQITFVGLQDIHPPTKVAKDYEDVIGARQTRLASNLVARAEAVITNDVATALAFSTNSAAESAKVQLETSAFARAALFTNQIPAFAAAPSVYKERIYYQAFAESTADARKYLLLVTNTHNVLIYNLEESIRSDLLLNNLKVPNESKP